MSQLNSRTTRTYTVRPPSFPLFQSSVGFHGMADQLTRTLRRGNRRADGTTKLTGPVLMECILIFSVLKHEQDVGESLVSAVTMASLRPYDRRLPYGCMASPTLGRTG